MAQGIKPTPTKYCEWCGKSFERNRVGKNHQLECVSNYMRRRFCSISCSVSRQHARPATPAASRKRAAKLVSGSCEACGFAMDLVVHHVNGQPTDNSPANLQTLCTHCHSFWHAMLRRTQRQPSQRVPLLVAWASSAAQATRSSRKRRPRS